MEKDSRVKLYVKLPNWFVVDTPIGKYNPDWAILFEDTDLDVGVRNRLCLVRETKAVNNMDNIRPTETYKILCGEKHFRTIDVDFKAITRYQEIINS